MANVKGISEFANVVESGVKTLNLYTLPLETFTTNFSTSVNGNRPKVVLELAVPVEGVGRVQIFAPSHLSADEQRAYLAKYFNHGMTIKGQDKQPQIKRDGTVDGIYLTRYEVNGPNYELISAEAAQSKMEMTGLNSNVIEFGTANTKLTRQEVELATSINRGNIGKVVAKNPGLLGSVVNNLFNALR